MKQINIVVITLIAILFESCGVVDDFCRNVSNNIPLDNNGTTYHTYSQQECMDMILNTREAQAWSSSAASKGTFLASTGLKVVGELIGKDFSVATNIMDATVDDLISDDNTKKSTEHSLIGAAFYGAGHIAGYFEDKQRDQDNAAFEEAHQEEMEKDRYFNCRYKIDEKSGRYYDVCKRDGMSEVQKCIRESQQEEAQLTLDSALAQCNPFVTQEDLDKLANGGEKEQMERHKIIYDALRCFNEYKRAMRNYDENGIDDSNESGNNNEYEVKPDIDNVINALGYNENNNYAINNDESKATSTTDNYAEHELEVLEQTKVNAYSLNSYELSDDSKAQLDKAADILLRNSDVEIELLGHSCNIGDNQTNYTIGLIRAKVAKRYLVDKGIDAKRISVHSMGSKRPVVPNNSPENRAQNRRVEIVIIQ